MATEKTNSVKTTGAATAAATVDTATWTAAGRNIRYTVESGLLFIAIPIDDATIAKAPMSGSGKSRSVGSTEGNVSVAGTSVKIGVNAYVPVRAG